MTIAYYVAAAFIVYGSLLTVSTIGKPRKPTTHGLAIAVLVVNAGYAYLLVSAAVAR